jgi:hypothetical protein
MSKAPIRNRSMQMPVRAVFGAFMVTSILSLGGQLALAQAPTPPNTQTPAPADSIKDTLARLIQQFPKGGPELISKLRELAGNQANLSALLAAAPTMDSDQKSALGSALAQAARIATRNNVPYATEIQQDVAASNDPVVITAFIAVIPDQPIGAGGGGGGGGGGGVGGQTSPVGTGGVAGGPAEGIGGGGVPNGAFSYTSSVAGSSFTGTGGTSTTSTTTSTVSP